MAVIETERLLLRHWREEDLVPYAQLNACARVCEFLPSILTEEQSNTSAQNIMRHFETHGFGLYAVEVKHGAGFIGYVGFNIPSFEAHFTPCVEIGWRLVHESWGNGYATEAALAIKEYGFSVLDLREIVSFTVPQNIRSRRVMEKIGMTHDAAESFTHPKLPTGHPLSQHVLYRAKNPV